MINLSAHIDIDVSKVLKKMQIECANAVKLSAIEMHNKAQSNYAANGTNNTGSQARIVINDKKLNQKNPSAEVIAGFNHAVYIEFGTRTLAKVPSEWSAFASKFKGNGGKVHSDMLLKWVQQRGITGLTKSGKTSRSKRADKERKQVAFLIARELNTIGIEPQPFMYPAFFEVRPKFLKRIKDLCSKI